VGVSFEGGNVWSNRNQISVSNLRHDESIFLGADTFIGPVYLAAGYDDRRDYRPRLVARFSTLEKTRAGRSPGREYSCLRAISRCAASRSAAVRYQCVRCQSAPMSLLNGSPVRRLTRR